MATERAIEKVLKDFNIASLKEEQNFFLTAFHKKDCIAFPPTGYGKSLPYQLLIPLRRELLTSEDPSSVGKIIECSPIIACKIKWTD